MSSTTPLIIGDVVMTIGLLWWVWYSAFVQRKEMDYSGELNILVMIPPTVLVGYGIYALISNFGWEGYAVLAMTLIVFVFFGLGNGGLTKQGIVGNGGMVTSWDRIKEVWVQKSTDKRYTTVLYRIKGMPGKRHFQINGASQKAVASYIKKYGGIKISS